MPWGAGGLMHLEPGSLALALLWLPCSLRLWAGPFFPLAASSRDHSYPGPFIEPTERLIRPLSQLGDGE